MSSTVFIGIVPQLSADLHNFLSSMTKTTNRGRHLDYQRSRSDSETRD